MQKINEDTDIIFDDSPDIKNNHLHVVSKRSFNQLNKVTDKDVEDMLHNDLRDNDEHWLWSHVHRIKRSLFDLFDNDASEEQEQPKNIVIETEQSKNDVIEKEQPKKVHSTHKNHHKSQKKHKRKDENLQRQNHHHAEDETILVDSRKEEKSVVVPRLYSTDRLKRRFSDDDDDEPDNGWDIEENEIISSGYHDSDIFKDEFVTKPHRFCKYFVLFDLGQFFCKTHFVY